MARDENGYNIEPAEHTGSSCGVCGRRIGKNQSSMNCPCGAPGLAGQAVADIEQHLHSMTAAEEPWGAWVAFADTATPELRDVAVFRDELSALRWANERDNTRVAPIKTGETVSDAYGRMLDEIGGRFPGDLAKENEAQS